MQILGGIALNHGCIAEMQTGEGKTLVATLPLSLHALRGLPVHLATANDYLAQRDADTMRPVYEALGLSVGAITGDMSPADRRLAYDCDITYGTAREFGFDFLRDRLASKSHGMSESSAFADSLNLGTLIGSSEHKSATGNRQTVQRHPFHYGLIDEADSLLIDEARTPLIVSSPSGDQHSLEALFRWCSASVDDLEFDTHFKKHVDTGRIELTPAGFRRIRALPKPPELNQLPFSEITDAVVRAMYVARELHRDQDYVVRDGEVFIVDEYTGRIAEGRKWRNGVHQAVEASERVEVTPVTTHCARITVQELIGQYERVSGMTGTAASAACEFLSVYNLPVVRIPTRRPIRRDELSPRVLPSAEARYQAIIEEIRQLRESNRPVLIGTRTIEQSEQLSTLLDAANIEHDVLNARNHAREAAIIADAGLPGRITVATNMAGRGTDIKLHKDVESRGGLHVICSEIHSASRIDRQLAGRCARQGDPGSFRQFMSLDDEVLSIGLNDFEGRQFRRRVASDLDAAVKRFLRVQRSVERNHERERSLLLTHTHRRATQLLQLGQDPWLDAV